MKERQDIMQCWHEHCVICAWPVRAYGLPGAPHMLLSRTGTMRCMACRHAEQHAAAPSTPADARLQLAEGAQRQSTPSRSAKRCVPCQHRSSNAGVGLADVSALWRQDSRKHGLAVTKRLTCVSALTRSQHPAPTSSGMATSPVVQKTHEVKHGNHP